jgi:hypothetical protein
MHLWLDAYVHRDDATSERGHYVVFSVMAVDWVSVECRRTSG